MAPLTRAGDVAAGENESKQKKNIPLVSGVLNWAKKRKVIKPKTASGENAAAVEVDEEAVVKSDNEPPEFEDLVADQKEKEGTADPDEPMPVCKSDGAGVMNCKVRESSSSEATISADGDIAVTDDGDGGGGPPKDYFQCKDLNEECPTWSKYQVYDAHGNSGDACTMNSAYMAQYCSMSCQTCDTFHLGYRLSTMLEGGLAAIPFCQDNDFSCRNYAESGECQKNPEYMNVFCEASCGICSVESNQFGVGQKLHKENPKIAQATMEQLAKSTEYMMGTVKRNRKYKKVRDDCLNKVPDCSLWAAQGECTNNPSYMKFMCAPACMTCDYLGDTSETCPGLPESDGPLWKRPGDLNTFFETVVDNADGKGDYLKYNPTALSRPRQKLDGTSSGSVKDGPWVVLLENFLTDEEADRMVTIGHVQGYERSTRAIGAGQVENTDGRTSQNTWCKDTCMEDPLVTRVLERIATATKSTVNRSEHLQLLRYEQGEFYVRHHDFIPYQLDEPSGARIMTLFLYLNDVEEGGNTSFPDIGASAKPKKGSAVLWPSVKDEDPMEKDPRTDHEAEVVGAGVKYGANAWIHSEDFQTPLAMGCI